MIRETKYCPKCKKNLPISAFTNPKASCCQSCQREYDKCRTRERNKSYFSKIYKQALESGKKRCCKCKQELSLSAFSSEKATCCRECQKEYDRQRAKQRSENYLLHADIERQKKRDYYHKNREKCVEAQRKYKQTHKDLIRQRQRDWYAQHKEKISSDNQKLDRNLHRRIAKGVYDSLLSMKAGRTWEILVNFTLEELKAHLESQFDENMTWENMGEYWEIDHIIPKGTFNITSAECREFKICWSLMNLRPLEWRANRQRPKDGSDISEELRQKILNQVIE